MDGKQNRRAVIVDAYSTGSMLARELDKYGIECLHVQTTAEIIDYDLASFRAADFVARLVFGGDAEVTAKELARFEPEFVIPGSESGVPLADRLSELLGVPTNGSELSDVRRNKARMAERLRECGVPAARTIEIASLEEAEQAAAYIGEWPLVLKPVDSAGADGLHFCDDLASLKASIREELGILNEMGTVNHTLLVMELLKGQQHIVQGFSRDGRHYISEIWRDNRRRVPGAGVVNDREILLESEGPQQAALRSYAERVLDAFGIHFGPSFLEIVMTERGPILIEGAARMMGTQDPTALARAIGESAVTLCAACYADPPRFAEITKGPYRRREHVAVVSMINTHHGQVTHRRWLDELKERPSFYSVLRAPEVGDVLRPTVGISTNYGIIYLIASNPEAIEVDYQWIRAKEQQLGGFFELGVATDTAI